MTSKLANLLVDLSEDLALQKAYVADPEVVMRRHDLGDLEKTALRSGDDKQIFAAIGAGASSVPSICKVIVRPRPR